MKPKVCILTAGSGKRLGEYSKVLNKSLLPLDGKAVISHIIEKFSADTEFVIAVGYKGEQVESYLKMAHPDLKISFVTVENFDGAGSGPGLSALSCRSHLKQEFFLVSADTLWSDDIQNIPTDSSWLGVDSVAPGLSQNYCNIEIKGDRVVKILDKVKSESNSTRAFIGLAFIKEPELFWAGIASGGLINAERQVSAGIEEILRKSELKVHELSWTDVGTEEKYITELKKTCNFDFSKAREYIYLVGRWVIKFYEDPAIARQRVEKSRLNPAVFPVIDKHEGSFYRYEFQPGETLYRQTDLPLFKELITWLDKNLWKSVAISPEEMIRICHKFYRVKTDDRISQYDSKYKAHCISTINGKPVPSVNELLAAVDWNSLYEGVPSFIHGDLQPDNILYDQLSSKFLLLDWRQDFAGRTDAGDLYYDFAKLWGGLLLNYDQIKLNRFSYSENENACEFQFPSHPAAIEAQEFLATYVNKKGYSLQKIEVLVGIIYLNMSPLHHFPFDKMLHALGRQILHAALGSNVDK